MIALASGNAKAQTVDAAIAEPPRFLDRYVVTGTYLPLSGVVQASPVVTLESAAIAHSGATDTLHLLKQLTPYFVGNNNLGTELNNGGGGESSVALRNLSTLVLLNGRRTVGSPFSDGEDVDVNVFPTAMIGRVEILKDGASTVYGSDAVGGVVNVMMRRNYNGFEIGGRIGSTRNGDYTTKDVYLVGGITGQSGSLTLAAQHSENKALPTTARRLTTMTPAEFTALGAAPGGIPATNSGTFAGRVNNSVLAGSPLAVGAPGYNASINSPGLKSSPTAPPQTLAQLTASGRYVDITQTDLGRAVGSTSILNTTLYGLPLIIPTRREQFVADGFKELRGKNLEVFGDFLYAQTKTGGSGLAPALIGGLGAAGANSLFIPANNPYNLYGVDLGLGAAPSGLSVRNRLEDLGNRSTVNETNSFRVIAGFRGEVNENYNWEVAFNYARASQVQRLLGGANGANLNALMVPSIVGGNYVYDADGRPLSILTDSAGNMIPVFSFFALPGFNAQSTLNAIRTTLFKSGVTTLRGVDVLLRGKPFELPAGAVAFAIGGENRTEDLSTAVDALFANGLALGYAPANTFAGGKRINRAAFAEISLPLTSPRQGVPGLHQFDFTAALRHEKIYPGGNATTPKLGLRWLPFDDTVAVRSTWTKGFIAPTIFDLFGPPHGNNPSYTLPEGNGTAGPGGATGKMVTGGFGTAIELSNLHLAPSKSESFTVGVVYSPKQITGLSFSLDYYRIKQDNVGEIDYTSVYADMNAKGAASAFAKGFVFADNSRLTSNAANQITSTNVGTLTIPYDPSGDQKTGGVDVSIDYTLTTERMGRFNLGAHANWLFDFKFRANPHLRYNQYARNFTDGANGMGGENGVLPGYIIKPYIHHSRGRLASSLFFNYVPSVRAPGRLFGGQSATNTQRLDGKAYTIPSYFTADLGITYTLPGGNQAWSRGFSITGGVNNLFNKDAPYVPGSGNIESENNTSKAMYDIIGRFLFLELKKSF